MPKRPGRPPRLTVAPATWSVRGVSKEARAALERGAAQAGKTLGQYLNEDVLALVVQHLEAPAPIDATLQAEIQYLRQLVENLTVMLGGQAILREAAASGPDPIPPQLSLPRDLSEDGHEA